MCSEERFFRSKSSHREKRERRSYITNWYPTWVHQHRSSIGEKLGHKLAINVWGNHHRPRSERKRRHKYHFLRLVLSFMIEKFYETFV